MEELVKLGAPEAAVEVLVEGLRRLEYRGYDSAGVAVVDTNGSISIRRAAGKLRERHPHRIRAIRGAGMLWTAIWSGVVVALWWEKIPESIGGVTTGKSPVGLAAVTGVLLGIGIAGLLCSLFFDDAEVVAGIRAGSMFPLLMGAGYLLVWKLNKEQ